MNQHDTRHLIGVALIAALTILLCVLVVMAANSEKHAGFAKATRIQAVQVQTVQSAETYSLPSSVPGLKPHERVTMTFDANVDPGDILCLHSVYASYDLYADGKLVASVGKDEHPPFMWDPPSEVRTISLDGISGDTTFRVEFTSPACRNSLYLYQPILGPEFAVLFALSSSYSLPMLLSILMLFVGVALLLFSIAFRTFNIRGRHMRYLGLTAIAASIWQFSENTLAVYLLQSPSVMYMFAFAGMFLVTVPIVALTMTSCDRESSPLLAVTLYATLASVAVAFALQLLGLVQLSQSSRLFSVEQPAVIVLCTAYSYYTWAQSRDRDVLRYGQDITLLAIGAILELVNYYIRVVPLISGVFQLFMIAFIVFAAGTAIRFARRVYEESQQKAELDRNIQMLEHSIDAQKQRNEMVVKHEQELRRLRHDLRHHLTYLNTLVGEHRYEELSAYLKNISAFGGTLERPLQTYCESGIANAIVSYYADIAAQRGYRFTSNLDIPQHMPHLSDGDLCVIVGNLLENAIESCDRATARVKEPEISFKSRTQGPLLFITLDNSLGDMPKRSENRFFTSKKSDKELHGIGLQSIQALAQKYDGEATFAVDGNMFSSELYLTM